VTNPAHGKSVKFVRPATGLRYHSIGSGSSRTHSNVRIDGVSRLIAIVTSAKAAARSTFRRMPPHIQAAATIAGPITFRMSTFRRPMSEAPPLRM
jgi:hypothetical protein